MPKRTMPVKTRRIELKGEYKGWFADIRTNPPVGLLLDAITAFHAADKEDLDQLMPPIYDLLGLTINAWNFVDDKGKDIPATREGLKLVPIDLLMVLAAKVQEAVVVVPLVSSGK